MRFQTLLPILVAGTALAAAGPRVTPREAESHRAQLVTLAGVVSEVQSGADGVVLRVGTDPAVAVLVPQSARGRFKPDPTELHQKAIEVTGFLTPPGRPLAIVVERQEDLRLDTSRPADEETLLRERVRALEIEAARLQPLHPVEAAGGITLGPVARPLTPLPPYATQAMVLAEHGVPTRVDWSNGHRVLTYGRERWTFDARGQLVDVRDN